MMFRPLRSLLVSIDLAVWEGEKPASDKAAAETYAALYSRYIERDDLLPPSALIAQYVKTLLARFPDRHEGQSAAESPWTDWPLIEDASGPFFYVSMLNNDLAEDAWTYAVETAEAQGLVCFDPQSDRLARP